MRKTKEKRRRKQKRKTIRRKGGESKNGAAGTVFYNPRPPCADENEITPQMYEEAAKISFTQRRDLALIEYRKLELIRKKGEEHGILDAVEKARQYINLPLKNCTINDRISIFPRDESEEVFEDESYKNTEIPKRKEKEDPKFKEIFSDSWANSNKGYSNGYSINEAILYNQTMTLFPKMKSDFFDLTTDAENRNDAKKLFELSLKYTNIIDGIIFLESIGLCHIDLHLGNVMESTDGIIKMIDITDIKEIPQMFSVLKQLENHISKCINFIVYFYLDKTSTYDIPNSVRYLIEAAKQIGQFSENYYFYLNAQENIEKCKITLEKLRLIFRSCLENMDSENIKRNQDEKITGQKKFKTLENV
jgi:hypothetical protein